jgi:predicted transcriptional regulator
VTTTRERIADRIRRSPGIHFRALVRDLDLASGQVQYHLHRLGRDGAVVAEHLGGRRHLFPPTYDARERTAIATLRRETARDIVSTLVCNGPSRPAAVADELGIARSTLEYHLDRLRDAALVTKRRDDSGRVTLLISDATLVADLLADIEPTLPERLVDRFTRLVDGFLSE